MLTAPGNGTGGVKDRTAFTLQFEKMSKVARLEQKRLGESPSKVYYLLLGFDCSSASLITYHLVERT